jgi:peptidoglycan/xylan/chitin deacetylase (PgdA/CDA1 family)
MPLDKTHFDYPMRRYGHDHDRYEWSLLQRRPKVSWPEGKTIALWITIAVEVFPLDDDQKPFPLPGSLRKPYPDIQTYTWRDYGNRVGVYRLMRAFDLAGLQPDWLVNAAVAADIPGLMKDIAARDEEIIAHGYDMATPHASHLSHEDEAALIKKSLTLLNEVAPRPIVGWMSPGKAQSPVTPDLLAQAGLRYVCDWPNDEMPYDFRTSNGPLTAMPHTSELDDRQVIIDYKHHEGDFLQQIKDHYAYLSREANNDGGRMMSINLHPWVIGQSHRIAVLEEALAFLAIKEDVWSASASDILKAWKNTPSAAD